MYRMAHGYAQTFPGTVFPFNMDITAQYLSVYRTAGTMVSNSNNIAKWIKALFTGRVLYHLQFKQLTDLVCTSASDSCHPGHKVSTHSKYIGLQGFSMGLFRYYAPQFGGYLWFYGGDTLSYTAGWFYDQHSKILISFTGNVQRGNGGSGSNNLQNFGPLFDIIYPLICKSIGCS